jgi:hypothetical protein
MSNHVARKLVAVPQSARKLRESSVGGSQVPFTPEAMLNRFVAALFLAIKVARGLDTEEK